MFFFTANRDSHKKLLLVPTAQVNRWWEAKSPIYILAPAYMTQGAPQESRQKELEDEEVFCETVFPRRAACKRPE